jgi:O-acetyl-ADP-ribose deacetylase (regulator of RNase III)
MNAKSVSDYLIRSPCNFTENEFVYWDNIIPKINGIDINLQSHITIITCDITQLNVDIIVNPANKDGLGCFNVDHKCLDNVIHRKSGPRLRNACRNLLLGHKLQVAQPIITCAFKLPCKYVIHVVGPNAHEDSTLDFDILVMCYINSIELARKINCKTIAFPCISTGLFGYPCDISAQKVFNGVSQYLYNKKINDIQIVFVCWDKINYSHYLNASKVHTNS